MCVSERTVGVDYYLCVCNANKTCVNYTRLTIRNVMAAARSPPSRGDFRDGYESRTLVKYGENIRTKKPILIGFARPQREVGCQPIENQIHNYSRYF